MPSNRAIVCIATLAIRQPLLEMVAMHSRDQHCGHAAFSEETPIKC